MPVIIQWACVGTRHDLKGTIFFGYFVDEIKHCHHVVIAMWFKKKILVILDLGCGTGLL